MSDRYATPDSAPERTCLSCHTALPPATSKVAWTGKAGHCWCPTCGQHWDDDRLAAVTAYRAWATARDTVTPASWRPILTSGTAGPDPTPTPALSAAPSLDRWEDEGGSKSL